MTAATDQTRGIFDGVLYGCDREVAEWVASRIPGFAISPGAVALGVSRETRLIAGVIYERFNGVHMEVSISAAEPGWASRAVLARLFGYPFEQMGCKAISCIVPMDNLQSLNLATKLGFEPEAIVKYAAQSGADILVLKLFRERCRWIGTAENLPPDAASS
jgi:RimJ/RimL family protein N-acetyltransferase